MKIPTQAVRPRPKPGATSFAGCAAKGGEFLPLDPPTGNSGDALV